MAQVATTIRLDNNLKRQFEDLCNDFGMSVNTAINIFVKAVVQTRSIPFAIQARTAAPNAELRDALKALRRGSEDSEFSLEEINEEITAYRNSRK